MRAKKHLIINLLFSSICSSGAICQAQDDLDRWQGESANEATEKVLSTLKKELTAHPGAVRKKKLAPLFSDGATCTALTPQTRTSTMTSVPGVRVLRSSGAETEDTAAEISGALNQLTKNFQGAADLRVKFKTFDVDVSKHPQTDTRQYLKLSGRFEGYDLELNATWAMRWDSGLGKAPSIAHITLLEFEEVRIERAKNQNTPLYTDATAAVMKNTPNFSEHYGYGNDHWKERIEDYNRFIKFGHNGLAIGDINGDGLDDLYSCQSGGLPNRLFVQQPDGTVTEQAAAAGLDFLDNTRSAIFADFDNDGDQDLALSFIGGIVMLRNDGTGKFEIKVSYPNVKNGYSLSAADYDLDGDLDLFVCRYYTSSNDASRLAVPVPYFDANNGGQNYLMRNDGMRQGQDDPWIYFSDATQESGISQNNHRFTYGSVWDDFDLDGDPDLYIANDFGKNILYLNQRGKFRDVSLKAGLEDSAFGMSAASGDFNRDGWPDIYIGNMFSAAGNRITTQPEFRGGKDTELRPKFRRLARGNTLFQNHGTAGGALKFSDVSESSGVTLGRWSWGSIFLDMNNDGHEDLFVANGFITGKRLDDL